MSKPSVIIVGSGAGGSVAAWELTRNGFPVIVFEKGRNLLPGLGTPAGISHVPFGNDEVKAGRFFENADVNLEPRTFRSQSEAASGTDHTFVGDVNSLPTTVGGGTVHWDAKVPRFWRQDFNGLSLHGPVPGANVADWPLSYEDLAPYYDEVEARLGVQGDVTRMPKRTLEQAPRDRPFPMPPNPPMYVGSLFAEGAAKLGYAAYPFPMAVNSQPFDGRPACNSCGFCSGFGCPIVARGGAAAGFLHQAMLGGAELRPRSFVFRVDLTPRGDKATGVSYIDPAGRVGHETADFVFLAASAIETARLARLSATTTHPQGLSNRSGQLGRNLMFHYFTIAGAFFAESPHAWRGPNTTFVVDDFVGPDVVPAATAAGLPYLKGGICETGGTPVAGPLSEAQFYGSVPNGWGLALKRLMRASPWRSYIAGMSMVGEDVPQQANRVDLDPTIRDVHGYPVARITHSAHKFEMVASQYYGPKLAALCRAVPGAVGSGYLPVATLVDQTGGQSSGLAGAASTAHIMGTARMGDDPSRSVVDPWGRMHELANVHVVDGSVFVSAGGFNPTLTIMALALRAARAVSGGHSTLPPVNRVPVAVGPDHQLAPTGIDQRAILLAAGAASAGAATAAAVRRAAAMPHTRGWPDTTGGCHPRDDAESAPPED
jgi:choline dehydrogenase-like flavoprotein